MIRILSLFLVITQLAFSDSSDSKKFYYWSENGKNIQEGTVDSFARPPISLAKTAAIAFGAVAVCTGLVLTSQHPYVLTSFQTWLDGFSDWHKNQNWIGDFFGRDFKGAILPLLTFGSAGKFLIDYGENRPGIPREGLWVMEDSPLAKLKRMRLAHMNRLTKENEVELSRLIAETSPYKKENGKGGEEPEKMYLRLLEKLENTRAKTKIPVFVTKDEGEGSHYVIAKEDWEKLNVEWTKNPDLIFDRIENPDQYFFKVTEEMVRDQGEVNYHIGDLQIQEKMLDSVFKKGLAVAFAKHALNDSSEEVRKSAADFLRSQGCNEEFKAISE